MIIEKLIKLYTLNILMYFKYINVYINLKYICIYIRSIYYIDIKTTRIYYLLIALIAYEINFRSQMQIKKLRII